MQNLVVVFLIAAAVTLILGIITQLVSHSIIITANAWNEFTQTLLLFGILLAVWNHPKKSE